MVVSLIEGIEIIRKDIGWLLVLFISSYQFIWPYWETKTQRKINDILSPLREDINDTKQKVDEIDEKVMEIDKKNVTQTQVTRAISRQIDGIDDEVVDDYLVENGIQVDEFIVKDEDEEDDSL